MLLWDLVILFFVVSFAIFCPLYYFECVLEFSFMIADNYQWLISGVKVAYLIKTHNFEIHRLVLSLNMIGVMMLFKR